MRVREQLVTRDDRIYGWDNPGEYCPVHETANPRPGANAAMHANLQSNGNVRQASWHEQVDKDEVVVSFPPEAQCWHAGDGDKADGGNMTAYAIEMCVPVDGDYDATLANTAARVRAWRERTGHGRDRVVTHQHWSGKKCPSILLSMGKWEEFVASTDPDGSTPAPAPIQDQEDKVMVRMVSPVRGYITQHYRGTAHLGMDLGTGGERRAVHAAFAGTVERVVRGRKHRQPASVGAVLAPYRSGNGVVIRNPDGERQLYGHVAPSVRVGQRVAMGERIGTVDLSGITTGLHLHFEIWNASGRTRNPMIDFRNLGVTPGARVPSNLPSGGGSGGSSGGGSSSVRTYQRRQNRYGAAGLVVDGHDGPVTQNWRNWVRDAQRRLNAFRSSRRNLLIDGDYGSVTHNYVRDVQRRNGLYRDGICGPVMVNWMRRHGSAIKHRPPNRP